MEFNKLTTRFLKGHRQRFFVTCSSLHMFFFSTLLGFFFIGLIAIQPGIADTSTPTKGSPSPHVVARGDDGFVVTEADVQEFIQYFKEKSAFQTTKEEYQRYTIQTLLFAQEAEKLGLKPRENFQSEGKVSRLIHLANLYLEHRLEELTLDQDILESYYRAFPEKFLKNPSESKWMKYPRPLIKESDLKPFSEVRGQIERKLKRAVRKQMERRAYEELLRAYHVALSQ